MGVPGPLEYSRKIAAILLISLTPFLVACGGSVGSSSDSETSPGSTSSNTYTISGTISGLSGTGLVLQDNGGNNLSVSANGSFTFTTAIESGDTYKVTVLSQPSSPWQTCTVSSGSGTASGNVTSVQVACTTNTYTIGGTISGLSGTGLVLQDNDSNNLTLTAGATGFTFTTAIVSGGNYKVSVLTQPSSPSQSCGVTSGSGSVTNANVTSIQIACSNISSTLSFSQGPNLGTYSIGDVEIPLTATGGSSSYTWSVVSGTLPPGMALRTDGASWFPASATAGLIGIATTPGTYNFTLEVTSGASTNTQNATLQIATLTVQDEYNLPDAFLGSSYSYALTALNNSGSVTWAATGGVPAGMSLSAAGVLSGTPTATGSYTIDFELSSSISTVFRSINLNVYAINITTPGVLPNATQNAPYNTTVQAIGGSGTYTFTASGLPSGVSMSASGVISGTPNGGLGRTGFTITAADTQGHAYTKTMTLDVIGSQPALPTVASYNPAQYLNDCTLGVPCGQGISAESGGTEPFTWTASGLPPGTAIHWTGNGPTDSWVSPGDAELWGTPTTTGIYNVQLTVTDATGASSTNTFPLHVSVLEFTSYPSNGTINTPYSQKLRVIGGSQPYSAQISGQLPAGMSFSSSNLTLSGTPEDSGSSFDEIFQIADSASNALLTTDYFSIAGGGSGAVQINTYYNLGGYWIAGSSYSNQLSACCASGYSWSFAGGTIPPGLSLSTGGQLSGTLTTAGNYVFLVKAADSSNSANYAVTQFTLGVTPIALGEGYDLPYGDVNVPYSTQLTGTGGTGTLTWTLPPDNYLPPGLTLASNGTIAGTPTASGQYTFQVSVADQAGNTISPYFSLSIYPPIDYTITLVTVSCAFPAIESSSNDQCTASVSGTGEYSPYVNWSVSAGIISSSGLFTAPTGTENVTVTATSAANSTQLGSTIVTVGPISSYVLTIDSTTPSSGISITASPADNNSKSGGTTPFTLTYNAGTQVTLTAAQSDDGYSFVSWTGCNSTPSSGVCDVTVNASTTVTANYVQTTVTSITISPNSASIGTQQLFTATVNGTGNYNNAVTWALSCPSCGSLSEGDFASTSSTTALYNTPYPAPASVTITATSVENSSISKSLTVALSAPTTASGPALLVDLNTPNTPGENPHAISPYVYGVNAYVLDSTSAGTMNPGIIRWGGNSTSRYNYQTGWTNLDDDYYFINNPGVSFTFPDSTADNVNFTQFLSGTDGLPAAALGTVPVNGWVTKGQDACSFSQSSYPDQIGLYGNAAFISYDGIECGYGYYAEGSGGCTTVGGCPIYGSNSIAQITSIAEPPPSITSAPAPGSVTTAWADGTWAGGWVNSILTNDGNAASGKGVAVWDLDNEPDYWDVTHRDVHPLPFTYDELSNNGVGTALAIKTADPTALVSGPVIANWWAFFYSKQDIENGLVTGPCSGPWSDPTDREAHGGVPMIEYYLQQFNSYSQTYGVRLLDYIDIHGYFAPIYNGSSVSLTTAGDTQEQEARMNGTRVFWDPTYTDPNYEQPNYLTDPNYSSSCTPPLQAPQLIHLLKDWVNGTAPLGDPSYDYPGTKTAIDEYNFGGLESVNGAVAEADILGIFGREGLDMGAFWPTQAYNTQGPGNFAFAMYRNYDGNKSTFGDTYLYATSTAAAGGDGEGQLAVYGGLRSSDDSITVMVINKTYGPLTSTISIENFVASTGATAQVYQYSNANLSAITHPAATAITPPTGGGTTSTIAYTFPGQSITLLLIPN